MMVEGHKMNIVYYDPYPNKVRHWRHLHAHDGGALQAPSTLNPAGPWCRWLEK